jgi:RNA recognition motif-containing protein
MDIFIYSIPLPTSFPHRYGFVRFQDVGDAQSAIATLDGTAILGHTLQVKFADADAGPPASSSSSGLIPSDSCYVKHLPASFGVTETQQLFEPYGAVVDIKLFPCLDQVRGGSALVRMATVEASERAIGSLGGLIPPGAIQPLVVRFAESATEKAARLMRREKQQMQRGNGAKGNAPLEQLLVGLQGLGLGPERLQHALASLQEGGMVHGLPSARQPIIASPPLLPQHKMSAVLSSICVKGCPPNADRLWFYENFARFGAIVGLRILIDEHVGLCNGTAFVNFGDHVAAEKARQSLSGVRAGDHILQVIVQQRHDQGLPQPQPPMMTGGPYVDPGLVPFRAAEWQLLQGGGGGNEMVW